MSGGSGTVIICAGGGVEVVGVVEVVEMVEVVVIE
jgi:hypothetical protein